MRSLVRKLDAATYWRLKAAILESALEDAQAQQITERAGWRRRMALREAGLDVDGIYELDDNACAVRRPPAAPQPPGLHSVRDKEPPP